MAGGAWYELRASGDPGAQLIRNRGDRLAHPERVERKCVGVVQLCRLSVRFSPLHTGWRPLTIGSAAGRRR